MGVELRYSTPLTATFGVRELLADGFGAVFLAVGASRGRSVPIENADADGVIKAIDYLLNIIAAIAFRLASEWSWSAGLVAIDAARTAVRAMVPGLSISTADEQAVQAGTMRVALDVAREAARRGALEVDVVSLESAQEMPAMKSEQGREELGVAREESVTFIPSWGPKRIIVRDGKAVESNWCDVRGCSTTPAASSPSSMNPSAAPSRLKPLSRNRAGTRSFIPQT